MNRRKREYSKGELIALYITTGIAVGVILLGSLLNNSKPTTNKSINDNKTIAGNIPEKDISVTEFKLVVDVQENNKLRIKLDSDVPDGLTVMLSAYRTYKTVNDELHKTEEIVLNYFEAEVGTADLKKGVVYDISSKKWASDFAAIQQSDRELSIKIVPNSISKFITVTATVPKNEALTGSAVEEKYGIKFLEAEKKLQMPLGAAVSFSNPRKDGVQIGMSKDEVLRSSWGKPDHKNITHSFNGVNEQWVYRNSQYLYFTNGILATIETH